MNTKVLGVGQASAGDDGIGLVAARAVRAENLVGTNVRELTDPLMLVDELQNCRHAIIIDALVDGSTPGSIRVLNAKQLAGVDFLPLSSHSISVKQALELAHNLSDDNTARVDIIGISINKPEHLGEGLSPAVKQCLPKVIATIKQLIAE